MTDQQYLENVLEDQRLAEDSEEMEALRQHREDVEAILRETYGNCSPTIKYGGSKAKGTLIRESYDLDLVCYFPSGEDGAGETLEEIFNNVKATLAADYYVEPKTSALRLKRKGLMWEDFHIDVVPGRFTDVTKTDCYLYQNGAEKCRLKTNLKIHIDHIRGAGITPALRLLKLWRSRRAVSLKNFVWELLCIKLLDGREEDSLADQLDHVLRTISESDEAIAIEDPANPSGNDLMDFLSSWWPSLQSAALVTVSQVDVDGWEQVFGPIETASTDDPAARLAKAAAAVATPTQPWSH